MSGILKSAKKVFAKVVKSKIFKVAAIAAAVYFTGGLAMAASGSAFAAGLPGISSLGGALGMDFAAGAGGVAAGVGESVSGLAASHLGAEGAGIVGSAAGEIGESVSGAAQVANAAPQVAAPAAPTTPSVSNGVSAVEKVAGVTGGKPPVDQKGPTPWYQSDAASKIFAQSLATGGAAAIGAIGQHEAMQAAEKARQQQRIDRGTIDASGSYSRPYKTPGIVTSMVGG